MPFIECCRVWLILLSKSQNLKVLNLVVCPESNVYLLIATQIKLGYDLFIQLLSVVITGFESFKVQMRHLTNPFQLFLSVNCCDHEKTIDDVH